MSKKKDKEIEIVIGDEVFPAELFWKEAPKTCELVLKALPLDHTTTKDGGVVGTCAGQNSMLVRWPKTFTVPMENATVYLMNGYLYWKTYEEPVRDGRFETSLSELYICGGHGGQGYSWGPQGPDPLNEFGKITSKLDELTHTMMRTFRERVGVFMMRRKK